MPGPMDGIKVVELGVWVAGPATGAILADWGAEVIKIEPPGVGDPGRLFGKMLGADLPFNPVFENDNRGKRGIVLDLSSDEGKEIALELIDRADVFVSNVRPAALARLGLDPATLLERNSRLVYGLITGYGLEGPDADRPAYDIAGFWARSGVAAALTKPGDSPPFQRGGMGDHCCRGVAGGGDLGRALLPREDGQGAARQHVTAATGRLLPELRSRRLPSLRAERPAGGSQDDVQPGHQQLPGQRRQVVLDRRSRGTASLAVPGAGRGAPRVDRRPALCRPGRVGPPMPRS